MISIKKQGIGTSIFLSIITLGWYQIYWKCMLVKNIYSISRKEKNCIGEILCLVFVPFYAWYWWFTRGKSVQKEFANHGHNIHDNGVLYLVLAILGLEIISMAIMQRDFNSLPYTYINARTLKQKTKSTIFIWSMLALPLLNLLVFWVYVNIDAILMAFRNVDYANGGVEYWTLNNFKEIYLMFKEKTPGYDMVRYGVNTMIYWGIGTLWSIPHSILLTYIFHKKIRGTKFFRVMLYLPTIICSVVLAGIFEAFVSGKGVFGKILVDWFNVQRVPAWFQEAEYANPMLFFYAFFFGMAGHYILFSGAMAKISKEVQEAAILDGATMWNELTKIYIPLMWPTISMTIVTSFAGIFGASGSILLFTPNMDSTFTFGYWIYDQVRRYQSYYIPSALGLIFTVIAYPLCLLVRKLVTSFWSDVE